MSIFAIFKLSQPKQVNLLINEPIIYDGTEELTYFSNYTSNIIEDSSIYRDHLQCPPHTIHLEVSEEYNADCVKALWDTDTLKWKAIEDTDKVLAKALAQKQASANALKLELDKILYTEMKSKFGSSDFNSVMTNDNTWKLMLENPSDFSTQGIIVTYPFGTFSKGDALDTDEKITNYVTAAMLTAKEFSLYRLKKINEYEILIAQALA